MVVINQMVDVNRHREEMECKYKYLSSSSCQRANVTLTLYILYICPSFHVPPPPVSVMDATNMEHIPEQCFDLVIDKGKVHSMYMKLMQCVCVVITCYESYKAVVAV
jgi:hypothetical protein